MGFLAKQNFFGNKKVQESQSKDEDILKAIEKMKNAEKGIFSLKTALFNFISYSENFKKYFKEINSSLDLIYKNSPYYELIKEITCKYKMIQIEIEKSNKQINSLLSKSSDWSNIFDSAKAINKEMEEKKKIYEHYEIKLSKIKKSNKKNYVERNENKHKKAASEYKEILEKLYNSINSSLNKAYEFSSQLFGEVITIEKSLFQEIGQSLNYFNNFKERFNEIKNMLDNDKFVSIPRKYTSNNNLMKNLYLNRTMSENFIDSQKKISNKINLDMLNEDKKNSLLKRMSLNIMKRENNIILSIKNENNTSFNSRLTTSFGIIDEEKLVEFYSLEDEFD